MPEKETNQNLEDAQEQVENGASDYIEAIQNLKRNTVQKDEYEKLQAENKKLLEALIDGGQITQQEGEDTPVDIEEFRKVIQDENSTNLDYCKAMLAWREELMKEGKQDPFLPFGKNVQITEADKKAAEKVAQVFQECVDYADGDSEIFTMELARRTVDVAPKAKKLF